MQFCTKLLSQLGEKKAWLVRLLVKDKNLIFISLTKLVSSKVLLTVLLLKKQSINLDTKTLSFSVLRVNCPCTKCQVQYLRITSQMLLHWPGWNLCSRVKFMLK